MVSKSYMAEITKLRSENERLKEVNAAMLEALEAKQKPKEKPHEQGNRQRRARDTWS